MCFATCSGVPLATGQVPAGTVSARVIRGGFDKPVEGATVQLTFPKGGGRNATMKTDAQGRAPFPNVPNGVVALVTTTVDGETITSKDITLGQGGGVSVLLVLTDPGDAQAIIARDWRPDTRLVEDAKRSAQRARRRAQHEARMRARRPAVPPMHWTQRLVTMLHIRSIMMGWPSSSVTLANMARVLLGA